MKRTLAIVLAITLALMSNTGFFVAAEGESANRNNLYEIMDDSNVYTNTSGGKANKPAALDQISESSMGAIPSTKAYFTQDEGAATVLGSVTLFETGDTERTVTSTDANLRWAYAIIVDASRRIDKIASLLFHDGDPNVDEFPDRGFVIPAGGFAVVFHCGENEELNTDLKTFFVALCEAAGVSSEHKVVDVGHVGWYAFLNLMEQCVTFYQGKPSDYSGILGDIDGNGAIDATDYLLLKSHVLGFLQLNDEQVALADISNDGVINATDYMLLKRSVMGTYKIPGTPDVIPPEGLGSFTSPDGGASKVIPLEFPDFEIDLQSSTNGRFMAVTLTVKNIMVGVKLQELLAKLYYDKDRLTLITDSANDGDGALDCVSILPGEGWENLTQEIVPGVIDIRLVGIEPSAIIKNETPLSLTFFFLVKDDFTEAAVFVPTESVSSIYADDGDEITRYFGNGDYSVGTVTFEEESFQYEIVDGEATITGYTGDSAYVVIPNTLGGVPVTSIREHAFGGCAMERVVIPESVTEIGDYAFNWCVNLTRVKIPSNVYSIGESAFSSCNALWDVEISEGVKFVGEYAFSGCSVTSIKIPSSVKSIGDFAFQYCSNLRDVEISEGVESIGEGAFAYCDLWTIEIPSSVLSIGSGPFAWCDVLSNIVVAAGNPNYYVKDDCLIEKITGKLIQGCCHVSTIPNGVTSIGKHAFSGNDVLTTLVIPSGVVEIEEGAFSNCIELTSIEIPSSVAKIGYSAFYNCFNVTNITVAPGNINYYVKGGCLVETETGILRKGCNISKIVIPDGVTEIEDYAFEQCRALTSVIFSSTVKVIGTSAFSSCSELTSVEIPSSVTEIGDFAFGNNDSMVNVKLSEGLTTIGEYAFVNCPGLTSIEIPSSMTEIGERAFAYCSGLTSIEIPLSVTTIGYHAFDGCESLTDIYCLAYEQPYGWSSEWLGDCEATVHWNLYEDGVFQYTVINDNAVVVNYIGNGEDVSIPATLDGYPVTAIGERAFHKCTGLTSVVIPDRVTSIGKSAFAGCENLKKINIPANVTEIEDYAFEECTGLTSVVFPKNMKRIGDSAFAHCTNLNSITIPEGVTEIGETVFWACDNLISITAADGNQKYYAKDNCLIEKGTGTLVIGCKTSVIPNGVTRIGYGAFYGCAGLTSAIIPQGVTSIGDAAFSDCSRLTTVIIPKGVTVIGGNAFHGCKRLTKIVIPSSVVEIGWYAFDFCSSLKDLIILEGVQQIGMQAFLGCTNLTQIEIPLSVTTIEDWVFDQCTNLTDIYCRADKRPEGWYEDWLEGCDATVHWGMAMPDKNVLTDEDSDVFVEFPEDKSEYYAGATLTAEKQEAGNSYETAKEALSTMYSQFVPYDIRLTDLAGKTLPVSGKITVSMPVPDGWKAADTAVYYVSENGKAERISCKPSADGNSVEFETDHFSIYTLVNLASSARKLGDLSGDGKINSVDYLLLKRYVLGTFKLTDEQFAAADISKDNKVNSIDYLLLKRHVLGTYKIS